MFAIGSDSTHDRRQMNDDIRLHIIVHPNNVTHVNQVIIFNLGHKNILTAPFSQSFSNVLP